MPYLSNLPPGCTEADIDAHFGPDPEDDDGPDEDRAYDEWCERRRDPMGEWW